VSGQYLYEVWVDNRAPSAPMPPRWVELPLDVQTQWNNTADEIDD